MILALLIAAGAAPAATAQPPARLHVPKAVRDARAGGEGEEVLPLSPFAAPEVLAALGPPRALVGSWAEYAVRTRGQDDTRIKVSILPPALDGGRYWLEVDLAPQSGAPTAIRVLVHGDPARPKDIERATLYVVGQAALELPLDQVEETREQLEPAPRTAAAPIRKRKPESVRTAAGPFDHAEVLEVADTRLWRSGKVPLWGLVRSKSRTQTVELIGYATAGAHSLVQGNGSESEK